MILLVDSCLLWKDHLWYIGIERDQDCIKDIDFGKRLTIMAMVIE
jgi:hypothetical protein